MNKQSQDVEQILQGKIEDKELKELSAAVKNYMQSRELKAHDTKDQVDLALIIFSILQVPEEEFMEFVSRLNVIQLKRLGVMESIKSGNVH